MKVLLDENVPHDLRPLLPEHDVFTVQFMHWDGVKNGKLLALTAESGFEVFITADQSLSYQQTFRDRPYGVVVLGSNRWPQIKPHIAVIAQAVAESTPGVLRFLKM